MLSIKAFCFLTIISLATLVPGKKGKMYLVEVESGKESAANSIPGSLINPRPRMQSKALMTPPPDLVAAVEEWRNRKHPGCVDRNGIMHRHGEIYYREEDPKRGRYCQVCFCNDGKKRCSYNTEKIDQFANVSTKAITDLFNCKNECGWMNMKYFDEYFEDLASEYPEHESIFETFRISKCDSCTCSEEHGYNCTRTKDACECGELKEGQTYWPKTDNCNTCVCKALSTEFRKIFAIFGDGKGPPPC